MIDTTFGIYAVKKLQKSDICILTFEPDRSGLHK
jgi:hypothetical protein